MIKAVLIACLVTFALASRDYRGQFEAFKTTYGRQYLSAAEEAKRFAIFTDNMIKAEGMNAMNPHAKFGVNEFADMSAEEFKIRHSAEKYYAKAMSRPRNEMDLSKLPKVKAGSTVDWRTKGAVTPIKNQGQCGSCWAFSSTGSIEGQWFLAGHNLTSVSEQQLVSCDTIDQGCNGGLMDNAWTWLVQDNGGNIDTEASYPYKSGNGNSGTCSKTGHTVGAQITGHQDITKTEAAMETFVNSKGPLSIAVDATSWQTYTSGIMTNCISQQIDHGVLIVGFDTSNNPPYWIIKNSWGTSWGEKGYIRVEYGKDECLMTSYPCSSIAK